MATSRSWHNRARPPEPPHLSPTLASSSRFSAGATLLLLNAPVAMDLRLRLLLILGLFHRTHLLSAWFSSSTGWLANMRSKACYLPLVLAHQVQDSSDFGSMIRDSNAGYQSADMLDDEGTSAIQSIQPWKRREFVVTIAIYLN
ncbi:hypothetical protein EJB05_47545, partial [Eragrostis curvula]